MAHASIQLTVILLIVLTGGVSARVLKLKKDALYFPDQVEYLRSALGRCAEEQLFWPGTARCYAEGTQGPCAFQHRLVWDERQARPRCEPTNSVFGDR